MASKKHDFNPREKRWRAAPRWRPVLTPTEFGVLLAHLLFTNAEGTHFPALRTLADQSDTRVDRASKATNKLCEMGILQKKSGGGRGRRNSYQFVDDAFLLGPLVDLKRQTNKREIHAQTSGKKRTKVNAPNTGAKHPQHPGNKRPQNRSGNLPEKGAMEVYKGNKQCRKIQSKGRDKVLPDLPEVVRQKCQRLADDLGLSRRLVGDVETSHPSALFGTLALTRAHYLNGKIKSPAAYATTLLKQVQEKGIAASRLAKLNGEIDWFQTELEEGLASLTDNLGDDFAPQKDAFLDLVRQVCPRTTAEDITHLFLGGVCFDDPNAAARSLHAEVRDCLPDHQITQFEDVLTLLNNMGS